SPSDTVLVGARSHAFSGISPPPEPQREGTPPAPPHPPGDLRRGPGNSGSPPHPRPSAAGCHPPAPASGHATPTRFACSSLLLLVTRGSNAVLLQNLDGHPSKGAGVLVAELGPPVTRAGAPVDHPYLRHPPPLSVPGLPDCARPSWPQFHRGATPSRPLLASPPRCWGSRTSDPRS